LVLAFMGDPAFKQARAIARELRQQGYNCCLDFAGGSLKSQLRLANKLNAVHVLIIGEDELARESYKIKRLEDSKQWDVTMPELIDYLQSRSPVKQSK
jgi:histidyl-tRNA synthetase